MIRVTLVGTEETITRFHRLEPSIRAQLRATIQSLTLGLLTHVKDGKLSGQVLNVRSGRLRRSITQVVTESGSSIIGIVGTNVVYGRVHEYGWSGTQSVRSYMRKTKAGAATVRAHTRKVAFPERSFLRSALAEQRDSILATINRDAREAAGRV